MARATEKANEKWRLLEIRIVLFHPQPFDIYIYIHVGQAAKFDNKLAIFRHPSSGKTLSV